MSQGIEVCLLNPNERLDGAAVFYLKQRITKFNDFEIAREFMSKNKDALMITQKENIKQISEIRIITSFNVGKRTLVIFSNIEQSRET